MSLSADQATEVKDHTLSLITLSKNGCVGVLKCCKFLLVTLALTLKFLCNLLLEDKCLKSIITLLFSSRKANGKTSTVILLLLNEGSETTSFTLVVLNLNLEVLSLLGKLLGESLELEELRNVRCV